MSHRIFASTRVRPSLLSLALGATLLAAGFPVGLTPVRAQLNLEYLVIDPGAGTGSLGALFQVDTTTGNRTTVSDFGNAAQGPAGVFPVGVATVSSGAAVGAVVIDREAGTAAHGALFVVIGGQGDKASSRTVLSDFGDANQGPLGVNPSGVWVESTGSYLVVDPDAGTGGQGALFRVDSTTGTRTVVSDFGDGAQGPLGDSPAGVMESSGGSLAVVDPGAGTGAQGALFLVDPLTGVRTLLSDFGNAGQGPTGSSPTGVSQDGTTGSFLVVDPDSGTNSQGLLFLVDAVTGTRTIVSDFGNAGQGPTGDSPVGVDGGAFGVIDSQAGTGGRGALFGVDPTTGERVLVSDFGNSLQGPLGVKPSGLALTVTCPATLALKGAPQQEVKLGILYDIRDKVLARTAAGQRYTKLFYAHAVEAAWLMVRHPELRGRARAAVERLLPTLQAMLAGRRAVVSLADVVVIDGLAQAFADKAGAELRADLRAFRTELRQGAVLREFGIGLVPWR